MIVVGIRPLGKPTLAEVELSESKSPNVGSLGESRSSQRLARCNDWRVIARKLSRYIRSSYSSRMQGFYIGRDQTSSFDLHDLRIPLIFDLRLSYFSSTKVWSSYYKKFAANFGTSCID